MAMARRHQRGGSAREKAEELKSEDLAFQATKGKNQRRREGRAVREQGVPSDAVQSLGVATGGRPGAASLVPCSTLALGELGGSPGAMDSVARGS